MPGPRPEPIDLTPRQRKLFIRDRFRVNLRVHNRIAWSGWVSEKACEGHR